ncbi:thiamine pyrophosphate-dependent enzyme [Streptomyces indonesiensis]
MYSPRTHLTSGGFSSMGWAVPAAIGAKLARPDRTVVCVLGDGDFLMTAQEIALSVTAGAPVVFVVQNNAGYMSIRGGQRKQTSRHIGTEFSHPDGSPYSPDFAAVGRAFGIESWKVSDADSLESTLHKAVQSGAPALVEVPTDRDAAAPGCPAGGTSRYRRTSPTSGRTSTSGPGPPSSTSDLGGHRSRAAAAARASVPPAARAAPDLARNLAVMARWAHGSHYGRRCARRGGPAASCAAP